MKRTGPVLARDDVPKAAQVTYDPNQGIRVTCAHHIPSEGRVARFRADGSIYEGVDRPCWRPDVEACLADGSNRADQHWCAGKPLPCFKCAELTASGKQLWQNVKYIDELPSILVPAIGRCAFHSRGVCVSKACEEENQILVRDAVTGLWMCSLCEVGVAEPAKWVCVKCSGPASGTLMFCMNCGRTVEEELSKCARCEYAVCDGCRQYCDRCAADMCNECFYTDGCEYCKRPLCEDCEMAHTCEEDGGSAADEEEKQTNAEEDEESSSG